MKNLLFLILCLSFITSYSQGPVFTINKKFKAGTQPRTFNVLSSADENTGELHLTLADNRSIERYLVDSNWKVTDQFSTIRGVYADLPYNRIIDMQLITNGRKEYAIYNNKEKIFTVNEIDFDTKKESKLSEFEVNKHESVIAYFTFSNTFCLVTGSKKNKTLNFISNSKRGGILFDTLSVELNINKEDRSAAKLMNNAVVINTYEDEIAKLASPNKIYYSKDIVYITNDVNNVTYVTEVNLKTGANKYKIFKQEINGTTPEEIDNTSISSYLCDNRFVTANYCNETLVISFYDYENEKLLKAYMAKKNDAIDFKNGPTIDKKGKPFPKTKDDVGKSDSLPGEKVESGRTSDWYFFKALNNGIAVRMEKAGNGDIKLFVESYYEQKTSSGGGARLVSIPGIPGGSYWAGGTGGYYSSFVRDKYINCLFEQNNFEHQVTSTVPKTSTELMKDILEDKDDNNTKTTFIKGGILYLGFYDSKQEYYVIKKIAAVKVE